MKNRIINIGWTAVLAGLAAVMLQGCSSKEESQADSNVLKTPEVKVSEVSTDSFRLDWGKVYGAAEYKLALDGQEESFTTELHAVFNGLEAGSEYSVSLSAVPAEGSSSAASETVYIHVTTSGVEVLDTPVITIGSTYASKTIITWSVVSGAGSYEYSIGGQTGSTDVNSVVISSLEKSKDYTFSVTAVPSDNARYRRSAAAEKTFTTSAEDVPAMVIVPVQVLSDAMAFDIYATPEETYYYDVVSSSSLTKFSDEEVIKIYRDAIIKYAQDRGISLRLAMASALKAGTSSLTSTGLVAEMSYDIIAFGMDLDGNVTTGLFKKRVKTTSTGYSEGPNMGGSSWFRQNFYLTNAYAGITGYGWTNSVWTTWTGTGVESVRYRLLPTNTFINIFSNTPDPDKVKEFLNTPDYAHQMADTYLQMVNSANGYNSVTPCSSGVSYTMSALATANGGEETLCINSITTKVSSSELSWFAVSARTDERYGSTDSTIAIIFRGAGVASVKYAVFLSSALNGVNESSYPAIVESRGREMKEEYLENVNSNGLALLVKVDPGQSYTVLASAVNLAGDKITKHASVTTTGTASAKAARALAIDREPIWTGWFVPIGFGIEYDTLETLPVPEAVENDLWTIIHNMNLLKSE